MTCANFTDLNQTSEETIKDYMHRIQMAYKCLTDKKRVAMAVVRAAGGAAPADIKAEGVSDAFKFIKHQLFLAGLKDGIHDKVLEAAKDTFTESVKVAHNLETIQNDHKRLNRINNIKQELEEERAKEIIWDNLSEDQLAQLSVIRYTQDRYNNCNSTSSNNQAHSTTMVRNPNTACRYCQKKGHLQKDCFARKRNKAPMVNANGKPYQNQNQNNRINNVTEQPAAAAAPEAGYEDAFVGSVANLSPYHHLNW
jgi:hypothetical protein